MSDAASVVPALEILESIALAVFTVDRAWQITSFNRGAEELLGVKRRNVCGARCCDVFHSSLCRRHCPLQKAFSTGISTMVRNAVVADDQGHGIPVTVSASLLRNNQGAIIGGVEVFQDLRLLGEQAGTMEHVLRDFEAQTLLAALERNNNNRTAAARELGIHKSTFFRKIKSLGIDLPHEDGRFRLCLGGDKCQ